ncbi:MAG: cobalamin-dependent protein [Peptococcaceae bacterium]|jgi:methylmalonyl-CoA mutase cobalamin-binding domain/chain|nr:cobalamin-dependent protein [Peptococcaceae bacterium]MDH7524252.1 cobalamin-dependent protein [Peptococcaceae bacterium]
MDKNRPVLLAPLDPVHDIGLKIMKRALDEAGYKTILLPPDYQAEEVIKAALDNDVSAVLVSRTLGYGVAELLSRFVDLAEAAGLRDKVKLAIGGMSIRPELAQELGYDAGFGPGTTPEEVIAFLEGREYVPELGGASKQKADLTAGFGYGYRNRRIEELLDKIVDSIIGWSHGKTSPGVKRAQLKEELLSLPDGRDKAPLLKQYLQWCDHKIRQAYEQKELPPKTRRLTGEEVEQLESYVQATRRRMSVQVLQHSRKKPVVFIQYGTGCPFMDVAHIKVGEAWGADGVVHFDPSWGARTEGFLEGYVTHEEDGSIITFENLKRIKASLRRHTLWQVRAHRGLNTPETVLLAGHAGADLTKINIAYGSLGGGTDPARLTVDAIRAILYAVQFKLPFDVVTNEELCGVPAYKAFAGMLITAHLGRRLGGKPILQPLFCYSPEVMVSGQMDDNYIDFNAAKVLALRSIIDAPIWPGAPIGFLTHTEDRVQSAVTTALHAALASSLGVEAISIASSDEAYSGGPISAQSRIDTLRAVQEAFRFFGQAGIKPTGQAEEWAKKMVGDIQEVLESVADKGDFVQSLYDGLLGSVAEGAYPGRGGRGTVFTE